MTDGEEDGDSDDDGGGSDDGEARTHQVFNPFEFGALSPEGEIERAGPIAAAALRGGRFPLAVRLFAGLFVFFSLLAPLVFLAMAVAAIASRF